MALDGSGWTSQEYQTDAVVSQGSILGPTPFLIYINDLPNDGTCNIAIYADKTLPTTLNVIKHLICGNN